MPHVIFYFSKGGAGLAQGTQSGGSWQLFTSDNSKKIPWKIHIYADSEADWQKLVRIMTRYMKNEDCCWKTLSPTCSVEDLEKDNKCQKGKAFTIYPASNEQFAKIAHDLNYILKKSNMQLQDSQITGDRALGDSGRIFYRYEYNSADNKDLILDTDDDADFQTYKMIYRPNTDDSGYLASDMQETDDPWLNFNPDTDGTD